MSVCVCTSVYVCPCVYMSVYLRAICVFVCARAPLQAGVRGLADGRFSL